MMRRTTGHVTAVTLGNVVEFAGGRVVSIVLNPWQSDRYYYEVYFSVEDEVMAHAIDGKCEEIEKDLEAANESLGAHRRSKRRVKKKRTKRDA